jgi:hypothetical protein
MDNLADMKKKLEVLMSKPQSSWNEEDKKLVTMIKAFKMTE